LPENRKGNTPWPSVSRRGFISTLIASTAFLAIGRGIGRTHLTGDVLRPPGAIEESGFLPLCIRCGSCVPVCPNSALRLQGLENGFENFLTPRIEPGLGYCIMPVNGCQRCIEACPVDVLQPIPLEGTPPNRLSTVLKMGTAFVDKKVCIPYALRRSCLSCKEICPVDGAISVEKGQGPGRPVFNHEVCVGCGACEHVCPTKPKAVSVTGIGAKREEWKD
jgi:ferredoxin